MSQDASRLREHRASIVGFGQLVDLMRALAVARLREARATLRGVLAHAQAVRQAMAEVALLLGDAQAVAPRNGPTLWIALCAEQAFDAALSERVLDAVAPAPADRLIVLGSHGSLRAEARGLTVRRAMKLPAHPVRIAAASEALYETLARELLAAGASRVLLAHARVLEGDGFEVASRVLLPLDRAALRTDPASSQSLPPITQLPPQALFRELTNEHMIAQLAEVMLEAIAAESLARMQAMASAHEKVEELLSALSADERRAVQESVTDEVVELASGLRARAARAEATATRGSG